jgi:hypothetical protein
MASQAFTPSPRASITEHTPGPIVSIAEQQTFSSDQLEVLVNFTEALDAEAPTRALAKETDGNTVLLHTLNSIVTVVRVIYP